MVERLTTPTPAELDALTALWEASVRATHAFLAPEDIPFFRQLVRREALPTVDLYVIRETGAGGSEARDAGAGKSEAGESGAGKFGAEESEAGKSGAEESRAGNSGTGNYGAFAAFAGIAGDMLEMLFVAPEARGRGLGRALVEYVTTHCGVQRVDVNEQNPQAVGFYRRMGFRTTRRDAIDPSGKPYPILHMEFVYPPSSGTRSATNRPTGDIAAAIRPETTGTDKQ